MTIKKQIIISFWFLWALSIFYVFSLQSYWISWETLISFVIFPIIGFILLSLSWKSDKISNIFKEAIENLKSFISGLVGIVAFLVIIFLIGVVILAVIKWAFQIVF
ncbi:MAG: hypothetical protein AAB352_03220 [Patescibacteria group bacterium]